MYSCLREPLGLLSLDIVFWAHRAFKSTNFVLQSMNHIVLVFISTIYQELRLIVKLTFRWNSQVQT